MQRRGCLFYGFLLSLQIALQRLESWPAWHGTAGINRSELRAAPGLPQEAAGSPSFWFGRVWLKPARSLGLFGAEGLAHSSLRENRNPSPSKKLRPRRHSYLDCWDRSCSISLLKGRDGSSMSPSHRKIKIQSAAFKLSKS